MKHALVKSTIIETAAKLFYTNGYNSTGINEIIKTAGIAKATLYNHFKSKEDICVAYLQFRNNQFYQQLDEFIEGQSGKTEKVLYLFDFLLEFFKEDDFNGCWCLNTLSELPKENVMVRDEIMKQKKQFLSYIQALLETSETVDKDQLLSRRVYLLYEAAISESNLYREKWPIDEAKKLCTSILK